MSQAPSFFDTSAVDVNKYDPYRTDLGTDLSKYSMDQISNKNSNKGLNFFDTISLIGNLADKAGSVVRTVKGVPGGRLASPESLTSIPGLTGSIPERTYASDKDAATKAALLQSIISSFTS